MAWRCAEAVAAFAWEELQPGDPKPERHRRLFLPPNNSFSARPKVGLGPDAAGLAKFIRDQIDGAIILVPAQSTASNQINSTPRHRTQI